MQLHAEEVSQPLFERGHLTSEGTPSSVAFNKATAPLDSFVSHTMGQSGTVSIMACGYGLVSALIFSMG